MSRRLEKLIEQKAWETLTDYGYNDAQLIEQLTDATIEKLTEQPYPPGGGRPFGPGSGGGMPSSWSSIINSISNHMELVSQGARPLAPGLDYDGDGQVTFTDLTIALSLWGQGFMPVDAQGYQAGALIIDETGLGEQLPPEGEELLNVLTGGGQNSLGVNNPLDAIYDQFRNQTGAQTNVFNPIPPEPPAPPPMINRNVSRTPGDNFGFAPQVPGYGQVGGTSRPNPGRPPVGPPMVGPF